MADSPPQALLRQDPPGLWLAFGRAEEELTATATVEVPALLARLREGVAAGLHAVGLLAYEAAPAFDPALVTLPPDPALPVAWFGLFAPPHELREEELTPAGEHRLGRWETSVDETSYGRRIEAIHQAIADGTVYQINYTLRLAAGFDGDPLGLFHALRLAQPSPFAAWLDLGRTCVCSVSPELFFELAEGRIATRPMKGTARRGRTTSEDREVARRLAASAKERAENLMIVDMARNDLGRIARRGSVEVERLFEVERYDSVFQMTSTVTARTDTDFAGALAALFPAASITGAPKSSAARLIAELEDAPRGVYTGTIGHVRPDGRARFSVAIRTVTVDRPSGRATYGTGGGIVWDSKADAELRETRTKALVLRPRPEFDLLETLLWEPGRGYFLLSRHLDRLEDSARYFGFELSRDAVSGLLAEREASFPPSAPRRVRLLVSRRGQCRSEDAPLDPTPEPWRLALAERPVDSSDPFLFHKTTRRSVYEEALKAAPEGVVDVFLWNERGELTESTIANLVLRRGDRLLTPDRSAGLLPGTLRAELLERGRIAEAHLDPADLETADEIFLVSSVRRWIRVEVVAPPPKPGEPSARSRTWRR